MEPLDERQHRVHGALVRTDEHAPGPHLAQVGHRPLRLFRQSNQPVGVVEQHRPGVRQRPVPGCPVDEPLTGLALEPPDGLADRRLRTPQFSRRFRETSLGSDQTERFQVVQSH